MMKKQYSKTKKIFVIGLDCAPPSIVFDRRDEFPCLNNLMDKGTWAKFRSVDPPITIPAWISMVTGKTPGSLGLYGFRHREENSYNNMRFSFSSSVNDECIWDIIAKDNLFSCLMAIPPSYPPKKINGNLISCFMAVDTNKDYTYPISLKNELKKKFGTYIPDVVFRVDDRDAILKSIQEMSKQHFDMIDYLKKNKKWDFFMFVEIGTDRINHAFWKYYDKKHHAYVKGNKYENVIIDYYKFLDKKIAKLINTLDEDTVVFVVSDHGAKAMKGAFCINQWLIERGYLVLNKKPKDISSVDKCDVNWRKTKVWGWGGYYGRIFLNVKGREPHGVIKQIDYEIWRDKLKEEISKIKGPNNQKWDTKVYRASELYKKTKGTPADLMVYFDNINWRSAGTIGHDSMYLSENDKGPDDSMHDWDGVFIMYDPKSKGKGYIKNVNLIDFTPTVLNLMGINLPKDIEGVSIFKNNKRLIIKK